jgi:hypothetical protein
MDKLLLTPVEAARVLGIGRSTVYELMRAGQLESVHIGPVDASPPKLSTASCSSSAPLPRPETLDG